MFITDQATMKKDDIFILTRQYSEIAITNLGKKPAILKVSNDGHQWDVLAEVIDTTVVELTSKYISLVSDTQVHLKSLQAVTTPKVVNNSLLSQLTTLPKHKQLFEYDKYLKIGDYYILLHTAKDLKLSLPTAYALYKNGDYYETSYSMLLGNLGSVMDNNLWKIILPDTVETSQIDGDTYLKVLEENLPTTIQVEHPDINPNNPHTLTLSKGVSY